MPRLFAFWQTASCGLPVVVTSPGSALGQRSISDEWRSRGETFRASYTAVQGIGQTTKSTTGPRSPPASCGARSWRYEKRRRTRAGAFGALLNSGGVDDFAAAAG